MNDKRGRQLLSPPSPGTESIHKKQNCGKMPADMSVRELSEMLSAKIDGLELKMDRKIENLATKQDLKMFAEDVQMLKDSNEAIKVTLAELTSERDDYRQKFEQMDRNMRRKNIIIKGLIYNGNVNNAVKDLFASKMKIDEPIDVDEARLIGRKTGQHSVILVRLMREETIRRIFSNIKNLVGAGIIIERDFTADMRQRMGFLLKVKRVIRSKLVEKRDKEKVIKVFGDRLVIDKQQFNWHDGNLWCGTKLGFNQLNSIFTCKFDEFSFNCLDEGVRQ